MWIEFADGTLVNLAAAERIFSRPIYQQPIAMLRNDEKVAAIEIVAEFPSGRNETLVTVINEDRPEGGNRLDHDLPREWGKIYRLLAEPVRVVRLNEDNQWVVASSI